jgi:hypothetical protein
LPEPERPVNQRVKPVEFSCTLLVPFPEESNSGLK